MILIESLISALSDPRHHQLAEVEARRIVLEASLEWDAMRNNLLTPEILDANQS